MAMRNGSLKRNVLALRAVDRHVLTSACRQHDKRIAGSSCCNLNNLALVHYTTIISISHVFALALGKDVRTFILLSRQPLHASEAYLRLWRCCTLDIAVFCEGMIRRPRRYNGQCSQCSQRCGRPSLSYHEALPAQHNHRDRLRTRCHRCLVQEEEGKMRRRALMRGQMPIRLPPEV
jgi:hypothetical protein